MIMFVIASIAALFWIFMTSLDLFVYGAEILLACGDVIIFALIIWLIVKLFRRRK